jgi:hypothetical protein
MVRAPPSPLNSRATRKDSQRSLLVFVEQLSGQLRAR